MNAACSRCLPPCPSRADAPAFPWLPVATVAAVLAALALACASLPEARLSGSPEPVAPLRARAL